MKSTFINNWPVILIFPLGFALRVYQVGQYSFWFDEAGVAMAASSSTVWLAVDIARDHTAAMPLDYTIAWVVARFSLDESWLRFPSVIWVTLSIVTAYVLFGRLAANKPVQLVGALLVATSPLLIQYSQELRFYSADLFFYLLSTILLLRALDQNRPLDWLACLAVLVVGFYFQNVLWIERWPVDHAALGCAALGAAGRWRAGMARWAEMGVGQPARSRSPLAGLLA